MPDIFGDTLLDALRTVRDPLAQEVYDKHGIVSPAVGEGLDTFVSRSLTKDIVRDMAEKSRDDLTSSAMEIDGHRLLVAQRLFATYGNEICGSLLLAALPQTYATQWGARVLVATTRLETDIRRRILGTAQFLATVTRPAATAKEAVDLWDPSIDDDAASRFDKRIRDLLSPWTMCARLRLYHEAIRRYLDEKRSVDPTVEKLLEGHVGEPLNQEDLLGTLLTFSISCFEVLERFNITWSHDEQDAYLHLWDVVGAHLGIGDVRARERILESFRSRSPMTDGGTPGPSASQLEQRQREEWAAWGGLRPPSVLLTRRLLDRIRARQWIERSSPRWHATDSRDDATTWLGGRPGRRLTRALVDELVDGMPRQTQAWPLAVMRQLAPPVVRDRLQLGGSGIIMACLGQLPPRRTRIDVFTSANAPNRIESTVLRFVSNEVTRRALIRFVGQHGLVIPGLEEWSAGLATTG